MPGGDYVLEVFNKFYTWVIALLPASPFATLVNSIGSIPYLAYLNWFFPITECLALLEAWLVVVAIFYLYRMVLSYIHLIG